MSKDKVSNVEPILSPTDKYTVDQTLDHAKNFKLDRVIVIGEKEDEEDQQYYEVHSNMRRKDALWLLVREIVELVGPNR